MHCHLSVFLDLTAFCKDRHYSWKLEREPLQYLSSAKTDQKAAVIVVKSVALTGAKSGRMQRLGNGPVGKVPGAQTFGAEILMPTLAWQHPSLIEQ